MITLHPTNLQWMGPEEGAYDLCAHGDVEFEIDGESLIPPVIEDHYTVSAAALYLLRSLSRPHALSKEAKFGQPLFPHCGHSMYVEKDSADVLIMGCPHGADLSVEHERGDVVIKTPDGSEHRISLAQWKDAVCRFSDAVQSFYDSSAPRDLTIREDFERAGYETFRAEWYRRRALADGQA